MGLPDFSHGVAQQIDLLSEESAFPIGEIDGEKVGGSGDVCPAISHRVCLIECGNVGLMKR